MQPDTIDADSSGVWPITCVEGALTLQRRGADRLHVCGNGLLGAAGLADLVLGLHCANAADLQIPGRTTRIDDAAVARAELGLTTERRLLGYEFGSGKRGPRVAIGLSVSVGEVGLHIGPPGNRRSAAIDTPTMRQLREELEALVRLRLALI